MLLRHVALRDGNKTRQARFRRQQIIKRVVVVSFADVVAYRENLPFLIEQEFEIRLFNNEHRCLGNFGEAQSQRFGRFGGLFHGARELFDRFKRVVASLIRGCLFELGAQSCKFNQYRVAHLRNVRERWGRAQLFGYYFPTGRREVFGTHQH